MGVDTQALLATVGLPPRVLDDRDARVGVGVELALWTEAPRVSGDPFFGLNISRHFALGTFGALDYVLRASRTAGAALDRLVHYHRVLNDAFHVELIVD